LAHTPFITTHKSGARGVPLEEGERFGVDGTIGEDLVGRL